MIIWSGFGFLSIVIVAIATIVVGKIGLVAGLGEGTSIGLGLLVGAAGNWFAGKRLNDLARGREMIDAKTGQRVVYRPNNSLFWIPMQWWSIVPLVAAGLAFYTM